MSPAAPLLRARGLAVAGPAGPLVEDVDLEVLPGQVHVLTGPNGGGKSTLLRAVTGGARSSGELEVRADVPGRLAYVPQAFPLDPDLPLTARELLALGRQARPLLLGLSPGNRDEVAAALAEVGLEARGDRPLGRLSGGELQRVLLAQARLLAPRLLLLDEPARGLDPQGREALDRLVRAVSEEGGGVLLVTHDAAWISAHADHLTRLEVRVLSSGPPAEAAA